MMCDINASLFIQFGVDVVPVGFRDGGLVLSHLAFLAGPSIEKLTDGCPAIQGASADADLGGESSDGEIGMLPEQTEGQGLTVEGGSVCADGKQGLFIAFKLGDYLRLSGGDGSQLGE